MENIKINDTIVIFIITSVAYFICYGFELGYAKKIGFSVYFISVDLLNFVFLGGFLLFIFYYIISITIFLINGKLRHYLIILVLVNSFILGLYLEPNINNLMKPLLIKVLLVFFNLSLFIMFLYKKARFTRWSLNISTILLPIILFSFAFEFGGKCAEIDFAKRNELNSIEYEGHKYGILKVYAGNIVALSLDCNIRTEILFIPKEQVNVVNVN